jgi:hypothetical protein
VNARTPSPTAENWPALPLEQWKDTYATLHMWTQIVGKVRLGLTPLINHWWNVALYVTARGLTTSPMPYGTAPFSLSFDFIDHELVLQTCTDKRQVIPLEPMSVADFYGRVMQMLKANDIEVKIWPMPQEVPDPIPFDKDRVHASYDRDAVQRFWTILQSVRCVFEEFRASFLGKCSPIHFFWGSFDLAVSRFSGRRAPQRPNVDRVTREAYSHEVSSVGFWPGGGPITGPAFYSYTSPEPAGFRERVVRPAGAHYDTQISEFILMYDEVRTAPDPDAALLAFAESTYEAGAALGKWDRNALERA